MPKEAGRCLGEISPGFADIMYTTPHHTTTTEQAASICHIDPTLMLSHMSVGLDPIVHPVAQRGLHQRLQLHEESMHLVILDVTRRRGSTTSHTVKLLA